MNNWIKSWEDAFLTLALVCFVMATFGVTFGFIPFLPLGLVFLTASLLSVRV